MSASPQPIVRLASLAAAALLATACTQSPPATPAVQLDNLTVLAPQSLVVDDNVIGLFEQATGISVNVYNMGSTVGMVDRIAAGQGIPQGWDLVYGIDNLQMSAALETDLFQAYAAPGLSELPAELQIDPSQRLLPVSHNYVMVNADRAWFENRDMALPDSLDALRQPEYAVLLAMPSPASDQAGRGFLAATAQHFGEDGFVDFWTDLKRGGSLVAQDWTEAYLSAYTVGSSGEGDRPLVLAYASAPAADLVYTPGAGDVPPSQGLDLPGAGFHQIDLMGIAADTPRGEQARALVDFLLGPEFQASVANRMFAFPVNPAAELSPVFAENALPPAAPVEIAPSALNDRMQSWLVSWQGAMED